MFSSFPGKPHQLADARNRAPETPNPEEPLEFKRELEFEFELRGGRGRGRRRGRRSGARERIAREQQHPAHGVRGKDGSEDSHARSVLTLPNTSHINQSKTTCQTSIKPTCQTSINQSINQLLMARPNTPSTTYHFQPSFWRILFFFFR